MSDEIKIITEGAKYISITRDVENGNLALFNHKTKEAWPVDLENVLSIKNGIDHWLKEISKEQ